MMPAVEVETALEQPLLPLPWIGWRLRLLVIATLLGRSRFFFWPEHWRRSHT